MTVTKGDREMLATVLKHLDVEGMFPKIHEFRMRFENRRAVLDHLVGHGLLRVDGGRYRPSIQALQQIRSASAGRQIGSCNDLLRVLKDQYRPSPGQEWTVAACAAAAKRPVLETAKALAFLFDIQIWSATQSDPETGLASRYQLSERVLDVEDVRIVSSASSTKSVKPSSRAHRAQPVSGARLSPALLIVTATEVESRAIIKTFLGRKKPRPVSVGGQMIQDLGSVNKSRVMMVQSEVGSSGVGASQQVVQKAIAGLAPGAVALVGIAFGMDKAQQRIGDILVSKQLKLYELQRVGTGRRGGTRVVSRGDKPHASARLLDWLRSADLHRTRRVPKIRFGVVLSGEKLVDNLDYRDQLLRLEPEALGGEMEGGGLYVSCQDEKVDWIVVKAICDWADGKKGVRKSLRQRKAAHNAATFMLHALRHASIDGHQVAKVGTPVRRLAVAVGDTRRRRRKTARPSTTTVERSVELSSSEKLMRWRQEGRLPIVRAQVSVKQGWHFTIRFTVHGGPLLNFETRFGAEGWRPPADVTSSETSTRVELDPEHAEDPRTLLVRYTTPFGAKIQDEYTFRYDPNGEGTRVTITNGPKTLIDDRALEF